MTEPLVKIKGYSVKVGDKFITLTKEEMWKLFYDILDYLNLPIEEEHEAPKGLQ